MPRALTICLFLFFKTILVLKKVSTPPDLFLGLSYCSKWKSKEFSEGWKAVNVCPHSKLINVSKSLIFEEIGKLAFFLIFKPIWSNKIFEKFIPNYTLKDLIKVDWILIFS
jgi:hypothetical protein